ncbi:MAG: alpha/beta fold hydrolase [Verrucomicrobiia bacterium]
MLKRLVTLAVSVLAVTHVTLAQTVRTIRLTTADEVGISAAYYPVASDSAPAVVLLHGLATNRDEWSGFASLLQRNGIAALAIDLRGHGESTRRLTAQGPELLDYHKFTPRDFQDMLLDVNAATDWLLDQPGINKNRIGIVGASLGANIALRYTMFNEDLAALLLLSPGIVYKDVRTDDVMKRLGPVPLRIAVSRNDSFAFESAKRLMEIRKDAGRSSDTNELIICTGNLHGAPMLAGVKGLPTILADWLKQVLLSPPPEPSPAPAPPPSTNAPPAKTPEPAK